jgi:hypothetical protein
MRRNVVSNAGQAIKELKTRDDLEKFLTKFGAEIVSQMGKEVDRLEAAIKSAHPGT